jgi:hypothetical protein
MIAAGMGRLRFVWVLSLPLYAGAWLAAHWLMHAVAPDRPEERMVADAGHGFLLAAPLCAACASMMMLLVVILLARPAITLGYELAERLRVGCGPRPPAWYAPPLQPAWPAPELGRPPILATGHSGRAPPVLAVGLA